MTVQSAIPDYAAARRSMVDSQLRPQGVTDAGVLAAMGSVAREAFLPAEVRPLAYTDRAISLGNGRFLTAPSVLGVLLSRLAPAPGERALVVGSGTGYSTAVLSAIGVQVIALESSSDLIEQRGPGPAPVKGALEEGHPHQAPYDIILIDGAVGHIPEALIDQLTDGGRMAGALVDRNVTRLILGLKAGVAFGHIGIGDAGVPVLPGFSRPQEFSF